MGSKYWLQVELELQGQSNRQYTLQKIALKRHSTRWCVSKGCSFRRQRRYETRIGIGHLKIVDHEQN